MFKVQFKLPPKKPGLQNLVVEPPPAPKLKKPGVSRPTVPATPKAIAKAPVTPPKMVRPDGPGPHDKNREGAIKGGGRSYSMTNNGPRPMERINQTQVIVSEYMTEGRRALDASCHSSGLAWGLLGSSVEIPVPGQGHKAKVTVRVLVGSIQEFTVDDVSGYSDAVDACLTGIASALEG